MGLVEIALRKPNHLDLEVTIRQALLAQVTTPRVSALTSTCLECAWVCITVLELITA